MGVAIRALWLLSFWRWLVLMGLLLLLLFASCGGFTPEILNLAGLARKNLKTLASKIADIEEFPYRGSVTRHTLLEQVISISILFFVVKYHNLSEFKRVWFFHLFLSLVPVRRSLLCWSSYCGFIFMGMASLIVIQHRLGCETGLLFLSFWIDLCHQAAGKEDEDDDDEISFHEAVLQKTINISNPVSIGYQRKCFSMRRFSQIQSRQRVVILVYVDLFVTANIMLGGALACYGILLFTKMRKVRSERASSEMWKVAGLAVVSVICFSSCSFPAFLTDTHIPFSCQLGINGDHASMLITVYFFIGSSVPSLFVLWVVRDLPPSPIPKITDSPRISTLVDISPVVRVQPQSWTTSTSLQNQVS